MKDPHADAVAIVGIGAILPDAPNAPAFWQNVAGKRYCISDVDPARWNPGDYYDPDPAAPDKTYSKIGGWVRGFQFDWKRHHIPPRVLAAMDEGQQWAVTIAEEALADYGYPKRPLDPARIGVVLGAAMGGELHYLTSLRIHFPAFLNALQSVGRFRELPPEMQAEILNGVKGAAGAALPPVTEDTMPGELANIIAGRVANILGLHGPNFTTDAACASSLAALESAVGLLRKRACDAVITGGVDRNMGPTSFVKFSKIGALSATGSRPFGDGANGFVMGEGCAAFLLRRLADAERDGDRVYAVIRGIGGSSDGRGKGITAPNPIGQEYAVQRAWEDAGLDPATCTLVEAHGTSTKVGDVVEVESLGKIYAGAKRGSIALGSAKSNIGHLKAGAGAAGLLKAVQAIAHRQLPPTLNAAKPNPNIDFWASPFRLSRELAAWEVPEGAPRRAAVSAYGFGGTNFHVVLEEHRPGELTPRPALVAFSSAPVSAAVPVPARAPLRGVAALGASTVAALRGELAELIHRVAAGFVPPVEPPPQQVLRSAERLLVDFGDGHELLDRLRKASKALHADLPGGWKALSAQGIFRGSGPVAGKIAFLYTGQGSQYLNMGRELARREKVCAAVFEEADRVTIGLLGRPLTSYFFVDADDPAKLKEAEAALMQTAITQPAVLTTDIALDRLLREYGFVPDVVMGHSLGEYAALVAAGVMPFAQGLELAAARGREMSSIHLEDNGCMAAVMAPPAVVEETLKTIEGYVVAANINSVAQCVIGGETASVSAAVKAFKKAGYAAVRIQVSHAFHTRIVAPASGPLGEVLDRFEIGAPLIPVVANVTGDYYPVTVPEIKETLQRQVASPVQWVGGLETLWRSGVRTFVEVGPKKALKGFVDDVLGDRPGAVSLGTNHPKPGDIQTFNHTLCGLWAAGHGIAVEATPSARILEAAASQGGPVSTTSSPLPAQSLEGLTQLLSQALSRLAPGGRGPSDRNEVPAGSIVISGTGLGLPGAEKPLMDPSNAERILRGEQFVDLIPDRHRKAMAARRITRVVKGEDGSGRFETIEDTRDVIRLAGRPGPFDLSAEYGVPEKLVEALDFTTQIAMAAGLDALREAGIPLVQTYRRTTTGKDLPERWMLPEALRDETGVIFASAFPGYDRFADELNRFHAWEARKKELEGLEDLRNYIREPDGLRELQRRISALTEELEREPYEFDRRFLFRILAMGHSQFAEYVGARGPNAQANSACASTAQAIAIAEDWIRSGRCRRVLVLGADVATGERMLPWIGAGFLASGAAATDDKVEEAALPFDRRRHGTIIGMGACALVVESQDAVEERGWRGIVELLSTETRNSAFHGTRLDVDHIATVVDSLVTSAERRFGINRHAIAPSTVFMSHETFTPARGGSAAAEVAALRKTFGAAASEIVIANTKGFTGHPMGVGIEDVIAVKILEHGIVPPVPNFREVDPDLGPLTLSRGGRYPVTYAIHLAAGFGSQISLNLTRRIPGSLDRVENRSRYQAWLSEVSGYEQAETEVVKRNLRIVAQGAPNRAPASSRWAFGIGPASRTVAAGDGRAADFRPAPMVVPAQAPRSAPIAAPSRPEAAPAPAPVVIAPPLAEPVAQAALPATSAVPAVDPVVTRVLAIVAEKTGYPPEMLELDLDLEADLGVDTVKQAEVFAAVREEYGIPRAENVKLRDFPTLRHVAQFVFDNRPDLKPAADAAAASSPVPGATAPASASPPEQAVPAPAAAVGASASAVVPDPAASDPVVVKVLAIVAEKTGYPPEMLELDLDLEADLGVDTVKQAEVFAAVRDAWSIPRAENVKLRDFPTLRHVVGFVFDNRPDLKGGREPGAGSAASSEKKDAPAKEEPAPAAARLVARDLADADRMPRRVPLPVLRPPLDLCKPTGVRLGEGSRVVVGDDRGKVAGLLAGQLAAHGVAVCRLDLGSPTAEVAEAVRGFVSAGRVDGLFWLPALDADLAVGEMDLASFREETRRRVKTLFAAAKVAQSSDGSAPAPFLVTATRLDGLHGYGAGAAGPLGGAVTGFTKAYKREFPDALAKAVDFELEADEGIVAALVDEAGRDPGVVEVGRHDGQRFGISFEERPLPIEGGAEGLVLGPETVFVVTGAAGGITSAIVADLAAASAGTFYLLDLAGEAKPGDEAIRLFRTDREALKRHLIEAAKAKGEKPTPAVIDRRILGVEREEAALRAVESVRAAGGTAHYRSVNLLDGPSVASVVDEVRKAYGRIDVLLHAGGIEISRKLQEKEAAEFDLVFDIKADGFFGVLKAAEGLPIGATVVFSSVAGRFGNAGQTDYSAANDLLCKWTSHLRTVRPGIRAVAIDWTAWGGIGMATRGSIPRIMEMAGIEMLPPEAGIPTVRRELTKTGGGGELVVAGKLGILAAEWDETGGLSPEEAARSLASRKRPLLMLGEVRSAGLHEGFSVTTSLDPKVQPFLFDHAMEGTPLLPGVMGTEAFAQLGSLAVPGYHVAAVTSVEFQKPFKFFRMEPSTLHLSAFPVPASGGGVLVRAALRSRVPARPGLPAQERLHFQGEVRMARERATPPKVRFSAPEASDLPIGAEQIYRFFFHGPAYQVLERVKVDGRSAIGLMARDLPPNAVPEASEELIAPRLLELCFQTAGIWEVSVKERLALPTAFRSVVRHRGMEEANGKRLYALVEATSDEPLFDARVVDETGNVYLELEGYRTVALPGRKTLER